MHWSMVTITINENCEIVTLEGLTEEGLERVLMFTLDEEESTRGNDYLLRKLDFSNFFKGEITAYCNLIIEEDGQSATYSIDSYQARIYGAICVMISEDRKGLKFLSSVVNEDNELIGESYELRDWLQECLINEDIEINRMFH